MGASVRMELVELNGEPGMLRFLDGQLESAQTFEIEGERIVRIRAQRNPDKLARIAQLFAAKESG
jgi:RNA polymerase sigma-70 factor (ECF subfamily)